MKILVADDEDYTREGLIESICWESYGIDEIMQAVNGAEALKIAKWFHPDIVLTDIRMPKMDGIAFATQLMKENPDSRIIFMSGYMEIEYLKSAIRLSAVDYIEKPIDLSVVETALRKAADEIREKKRSKEATQASREVQQQKLFRLLTSKEPDKKTVEKLAGELDFPLQHCLYVCLNLLLRGKDGTAVRFDDVWNRLSGLPGRALGILAGKNRAEMLLAYSEKETYRLPSFYGRILETFSQSQLGIGMEVRDPRAIYNSYRTAAAAINCAFYQEEERLFQIDEAIFQRSFVEPGLYSDFLQVLSQHPEQLSQWFESLFAQLREKKYYHKEQVYTLMVSLLTAVYRKFPELYGVHPGILKEEQIQPHLLSLDNLKEIQLFTQPLFLFLEKRRQAQSGYNRVVRGVQDYIAQHYQEETLSVSSIAEQFHFSPAYLNVLFKQELKVTLKQYISSYRLERAKMMLDQGYDRVSEIAEQCGYANANYFAKVFREATGMSPLEYRKEKCEKR